MRHRQKKLVVLAFFCIEVFTNFIYYLLNSKSFLISLTARRCNWSSEQKVLPEMKQKKFFGICSEFFIFHSRNLSKFPRDATKL